MITAADLLEGPRGRRFCTELLRQVLDEDSRPAGRLREVFFWAGYHLDRARGESGTLFGPGADHPEPAPGDDRVAAALGAAVDTVDPSTVRPVHVLRALADAATFARYWQEPDAEDLILVLPAVAPVLARLADLWAGTPAVAATVAVSDSRQQWSTVFDGPFGPEPHRDTDPGTAERLLNGWRRDLQQEVEAVRPRDLHGPVDALHGGEWWSTPPSGLLVTSAAVPDLGPLTLWAVEDDMGWERAVVTPVVARPDPRVLVVDGPDDWDGCCRRWPVDVSGTTRRHDWHHTTGRDGAWITPDWSGVAEEYDAVRITVRGWLRAAGRAIPVGADVASVIAGWTPGSTVWLRDPVPVLEPSRSVAMVFDRDDLGWHPVA